MPKKRGRKRKNKKQPASKQQKSTEVSSPDVIVLDENEEKVETTKLSKDTSSRVQAELQTPPQPQPQTPVSCKPSSFLREIPVIPSIKSVPPEETLERKMSLVLKKMQNSKTLPERLQTGKTVSNVGLVVDQDPIIDLTFEDDEVSSNPWQAGEVVFAHANGLPAWPAVVDYDHDVNELVIPKEGPPEYIHVVFLGLSIKAWVPMENVTVCDESRLKPLESLGYKFTIALQKARTALSLPRLERIANFGTCTVEKNGLQPQVTETIELS